MITVEGARSRLEAVGYLVRDDAHDPGVLRAYSPGSGGDLVALVVIRAGLLSYAEFKPPVGRATLFYGTPRESAHAASTRVTQFFAVAREVDW